MEENREKATSIFAKITKPFDLSEATKLSMVFNASQQVNQQHLRDTFMKNFCRYSNSEFDDNDSRFSFSNSDSSPQHVGLIEKEFKFQKLKNCFYKILEWQRKRPRFDRHHFRFIGRSLRWPYKVLGSQPIRCTSNIIVGRPYYCCRKSRIGFIGNFSRNHHSEERNFDAWLVVSYSFIWLQNWTSITSKLAWRNFFQSRISDFQNSIIKQSNPIEFLKKNF